MDAAQFQKLEPSLNALQNQWSESIELVSPLDGGLTNQCWKIVTSCGRRYVWRPHSPATQSFSISRLNEFKILKSLESTKLAPQAILLLPEGLLVEWIDGREFKPENVQDSVHVVMHCLAALHQCRVLPQGELPIFDYSSCIEGYWSSLSPLDKTPQYERFQHFINSYDDLERRTEALFPPCLCHFDLGSYNIIETVDSNYTVIDWEYAAIASPIVDIATSILAGQFDVKVSIDSYFKSTSRLIITDSPSSKSAALELVLAWTPYLRFMALLWHQINYSMHQRASDQQAIEILDAQLKQANL